MKKLFLLRHAKSDWHAGAADDFARPLNSRGQKDAARMGEWLVRNDYIPKIIIGSPAVRVRQTIKLLGKSVSDIEVIWNENLYNASAETINAIAAEHLENFSAVMIVAHNPGISQAAFAYGGTGAMPTCGLAVIELDGAQGRLIKFTRPAEFDIK